MRVSKGGQRQGRLPILRDAALRAAPQDEVVWFYLLGIRFSQALGNPSASVVRCRVSKNLRLGHIPAKKLSYPKPVGTTREPWHRARNFR